MSLTVGNVSVAPNVLVRLVSLAAREVPGVARLGSVPPIRVFGTAVGVGVAVRVAESGVVVDCYVIAAQDVNLLELGITVQATVAAVIEDVAGMAAHEVNIYIQDVEIGRG